VIRGHARVLFGFAAAVMSAAAILSDSRSGVISLVVSMVFMIALHLRSRAALAPLAVVMLAIVLGAVWIGVSGIVERFGDSVDQLVQFGTPDIGRAGIWHGALNMIVAHPLLGVGLGAFETMYPTYGVSPSSLRVNYAHNDYLQILAETGIVGAGLAVYFIAIIMIRIYRSIWSRDPLLSGMSLAAGAGIIAVLVQSLADTDLQIPSNALLFLVLVAVISR
jgi:O-antigen ligase